MTALITAYCACRLCCGPSAAGLCADGRPVAPGAIGAPRAIPFGTVVHVEGLGRFVVRDRTARRFDGRWDIYLPRHHDAVRFGVQRRRVWVDGDAISSAAVKRARRRVAKLLPPAPAPARVDETCWNCDFWEMNGDKPWEGFCPVFSKITKHNHGFRCTAFVRSQVSDAEAPWGSKP